MSRPHRRWLQLATGFTPPVVVLLGVLMGGGLGCNRRVPVPADDASVVATDGPIHIPDGPARPSQLCAEAQAPPPTIVDPRGNFTLVTSPDARVAHPTVENAPTLVSTAVVDHRGVAALALTRAAAGSNASDATDPGAALNDVLRAVSGADGVARVAVRGSGSRGSSPDGDPQVTGALWEITMAAPIGASRLRNQLLPTLLRADASDLSDLPPAPAEPTAQHLVIELTLSIAGPRMAIAAAFAPRESYDDASADTSFIVDDLGNGTAMALGSRGTDRVCDTGLLTRQPVADIIFVIDESGSTNDNRNDIVRNANLFFDKALAAGLDFRIGVAGMKNPAKGPVVGKFCSAASDDHRHDGGEDRFLSTDERHIFSACIKNPPYFEGGAEFGLAHGLHAVKRHLPRTDDPRDLAHIRTNADLALVFVTDEAPQELKSGTPYEQRLGFLSYGDYRSEVCSLSPPKRQLLDDYLRPWLDLFGGLSDPEARATVHVIGGVCSNSCRAELAYGYQELAQRLGGQVGDICQADLGATLQLMVESIVAAASPRVLHHRPISSTMIVEVNGVRLPRSREKGYIYNAAANSLTFVNVEGSIGAEVVASYRQFTPPLATDP